VAGGPGKRLTLRSAASYSTRHAMGTSTRTGFFYFFYFYPESAHRL
jgi:hypothetical protein